MPVKISLTQFLTFNAKVSTSAKITYVSSIKRQTDYSPAFDYWKGLRDAIKDCFKYQKPVDSLLEYSSSVRPDKVSNYEKATKKLLSFTKGHTIRYFDVPHAIWTSESGSLQVTASPELGLDIDGKRYLVKIYYKKPDGNTKVVKRNIGSTLMLMQLARLSDPIDNAKSAVLNLQNGRLYSNSNVSKKDQLELKVDADSFVNIYDSI